MRTFCVLTQDARDDVFCDGVFEDGMRVLHEGRLSSLLFSRVLSATHDLARAIDGPLIAALQEKRPALLVAGLPGAEAPNDSMTPFSPSRETRARLAACGDVVMGLYVSLLQLVFENLPDCLGATCSVVTASANDRWLYDGLQGKRVRTLEEVEWRTIDRSLAMTDDGFATLLSPLALRHDGLQAEAGSLASETACVVTIHLEPYAPLILVDVGSDQDVLQQLTLILGMSGACGRRTYPPRSSPLVSLLQEYVVSEAALHVVVVPEPVTAPRHTMRLMRFASGLEAHRQESLILSHATTASSARRRDGDVSVLSSTRSSPAAAAARVRARRARAPNPSEPMKETFPRPMMVRQPRNVGARAAQERAVQEALSIDVTSPPLKASPTTATTTRTVRSTATPMDGTPQSAIVVEPSTQAGGVQPLAPSSDHLLTLRVHTLEAALEDVKNAYTREHASRIRLERENTTLQADAQQQQADVTARAGELAKLRADNVEFAELVPRLMKKVANLEKAKTAWETERHTMVHERDVAQRRIVQLETLLTHLKRQVAQQERQRALNARERTLHGILEQVADTAEKNARLAGRSRRKPLEKRPLPSSQHARGRVLDSPDDAEEEDEVGSDSAESDDITNASNKRRLHSRLQLEPLHAITVDELRRRNASLEAKVEVLSARLARASAAPSRDPREPLQTSVAPGDVSESAPFLRERLEYFMSELSRTRQEKDSLTRYILENRDRLHPTRVAEEDAAGRPRPRHEDTDGGIHSYQEPSSLAEAGSPPAPAPSSHRAQLETDEEAPVRSSSAQAAQRTAADSPAETCPICCVLAALHAGCASLLTVQSSLLAEVTRHPEDAAANGLSASALEEHIRAITSLQAALTETGSRAVFGVQHGPHTVGRPFPSTANMANSATLSEVLSFESERAARLASFVPSFTQLAVATENLLMRVPRRTT